MALRENLTPKLLAVLLALVVYAHVSTEREHETDLVVPLRVARLPEGLVVEEAPHELTARIQARGKQKLFWKLKVKSPEIVVDLAGARPGVVQRKLSPGDVQLPVGMDLVVTEVLEPRLISFSVDTLLTRTLPVRVSLSGEPPVSYRIGVPAVLPPRVQVRGPSRALAGLDTLETDPVDLASLQPGRSLQVPLDPGRPGVVADPPRVQVEFPVKVMETRTWSGIEVGVSGLPPGFSAKVDPDRARVSIRARAATLDSLLREDPRIQVDCTGLGPGRHLVVGRLLGVDPPWEVVLIRPDRFLVEVSEEIP